MLRGGCNIYNLDVDTKPKLQTKIGNSFYIGFFGDMRLSKTVALAQELQFSVEGANVEKCH